MKLQHRIQSLTNSTTPAALLAAWQAIPIRRRLEALRKHAAPGYPGRPCNAPFPAEGATLADWRRALIHDPAFMLADVPQFHGTEWHSLNLSSRHVRDWWRGKDVSPRSTAGWYVDQWQNDTTEPYAVKLDRFPDAIFPAISDPWNDWVTVDLADPYPATDEGMYEAIRAANQWAEKWAKDSREFYEKEEARNRLSELRGEVRELIADIRALCPTLGERKAAASALRSALGKLLSERAKLQDVIA